VWLLANPGKHPLDLLVLESRQDQGEGRDKTAGPASVDIHFSIARPGTGGASAMTSEPETTATTTMRVLMTAAAAKTKTMSITVTTTLIGCRRDKFTLLIAVVEILFRVTK